jgi:hypothetical protein
MTDASAAASHTPIAGALHRSVGGVHEDVVAAGDARIKRVVYPPGYRWSTHIAPEVGTDLCMHAHVGFLVQGQMRVEYADGCTATFVAPQPVVVDAGHDAWVLGDDTAVFIQVDFERETIARFNLPATHQH